VSRNQTIPFYEVCDVLSENAQPYDVLFFADGILREDTFSMDDVRQYGSLILPDCRYLTSGQARVLAQFLDEGGRLLVLSGLGENLPQSERVALLPHPNMNQIGENFVLEQLPSGRQARLESTADIAINVQRVVNGAAIHLIRYDFDEERDCVPILPELTLDVRLSEKFTRAEVYAPNGEPECALSHEGEFHRLTLRNVPLYTVILLTN
jgi:hypothetical protein